MDIFTLLFHQPIYNLLMLLYQLLGNNLALALMGVALMSRLITFPITMRQIRMAEKSRELNEKMKEVKKKHKNNKEKQTEELMKVQSEYLPGQIAGCLPMIIQFILFISILNVIRDLFATNGAGFAEMAYSFIPQLADGQVINKYFLGIDLAQTAGGIGYDNLVSVAPYVILAILVGITQFASTRVLMGMRNSKKEDEGKEGKSNKGKDSKKKKKAAAEPEDFSEIMQRSTKQTMFLLPIMIGFMSLNFPAGLSLYWTVQSGFVIIQQFLIQVLQRNDR